MPECGEENSYVRELGMLLAEWYCTTKVLSVLSKRRTSTTISCVRIRRPLYSLVFFRKKIAFPWARESTERRLTADGYCARETNDENLQLLNKR